MDVEGNYAHYDSGSMLMVADVVHRRDSVFIADVPRGFRVFDVGSPEEPVEICSWDSPFTDGRGIAVSDDCVYLANGGQGLAIFCTDRIRGVGSRLTPDEAFRRVHP